MYRLESSTSNVKDVFLATDLEQLGLVTVGGSQRTGVISIKLNQFRQVSFGRLANGNFALLGVQDLEGTATIYNFARSA